MVRSRKPRIINGASSSSTSTSAATLSSAFTFLGLQNLIPGLPNDLALLCLAALPLPDHRRLRCVSRSWNAALSPHFILHLRHTLRKTHPFLFLFRDDPSLSPGEIFDPRSLKWSTFPPMPCNPSQYSLSNFECLPHNTSLFVIGGSLFDTRSFPMDQPVPSASVFAFHPLHNRWERCADMITPRGSFAAAVHRDHVYVAGGGSRHAQFRAGGDRLCTAERYDVVKGCWEGLPGLSGVRAGCSGFFVRGEFWVVGGYGVPGTISGVLPVDEYYSDGEVLCAGSGVWRRLQPMWEEGDRLRLGRVAVLYEEGESVPCVFMLEDSKLLRFDFGSNRWYPESQLPLSAAPESLCRLVCIDGEVYVIPGGVTEQRSRSPARGLNSKSERRRCNVLFQIYNPVKRTWRSVVTKPPLDHSGTPPWGAMCVMNL